MKNKRWVTDGHNRIVLLEYLPDGSFRELEEKIVDSWCDSDENYAKARSRVKELNKELQSKV